MAARRRKLADQVMSRLARLLVRVFFRQIDVDGASQLPAEGPVVVVANHHNGLVDGLLLMAALGRHPRFLGKATLWKILPLRPFLALAGVVPVHRSSDGAGPGDNGGAFRTCRRILAEGGVVAVFPEGVSHDEPALQPLKTGAARIALEAAGDGIDGIVCVPVGLVYDARARFRSRALVAVGCPLGLGPWIEPHGRAPREAVRSLTAELAGALREVNPDHASWTEAAELARLAAIVCRPPGDDDGDGQADLAEQHRVAQALHHATAGGDRMGLREALRAYERELALLGVSDAELATMAGHRALRRRRARSAAVVIAVLPAALVGVVVHAIPYQVIKRVSQLPRNESIKATVKLLGCFGLFTVAYAGTGAVVGWRRGPWAGLAAFAAAPLTGYAALRSGERLRAAGGAAAVARAMREHPGRFADLVGQRAALVDVTAAALDARSRGAVAHAR